MRGSPLAGLQVGGPEKYGLDFADPQIRHRAMAITAEREADAVIPGIRAPIHFSDADLALGPAAPLLGKL